MDAATRKQFKENLKYWANFKENNAEYISKFEEIAKTNRRRYRDSLGLFKNYLHSIEVSSNNFLSIFTSIKFNRHKTNNIVIIIKALNMNCRSFKNECVPITQNSDLDSINTMLINIDSAFTKISEVLSVPGSGIYRVDYTYQEIDDDAYEALTLYTSRGQLSNSDPGYDNSPIGMLEKFVLGKGTAIKEYFGVDSIMNRKDKFESMFYAIVAPSMEGKTQTPFTFKKLKSLYFVMSESSLEDDESIQDIYKNFIPLSKMLQEYAMADLALVKESNRNASQHPSIYSQVSMTALKAKHLNTKFRCLGFVMGLIEHAKSNFNGSKLKWMEFFATARRNFTFDGMSLNDVKRYNFGEFIFFFDEFEGKDWAVFVRNLFRAVALPVFVANTNTDAANLVGRAQSRHSRVEIDRAWSLVSVQLNSINKNILEEMCPDLSAKVNQLILKSKTENVLIKRFFEEFLANQSRHLRPGFADIIGSLISEIAVEGRRVITLNLIFETIISGLANDLMMKKPRMNTSPQGILGTLALFMNNAYLSTKTESAEDLLHLKAYLQDHFFYLVNPVDSKNWCFLTYPPSFTTESSNNKHLKPLKIPDKNASGGFSDWKIERTFFKKEEVLPFLTCQSIVSFQSISHSLKSGIEEAKASFKNTGEAANQSQNDPLSGNYLEVLASVCIIEASHHNFGSKRSTFSGQTGKTFIMNLIENCIDDDGFRGAKKVTLNYTLIKKLLDRIHVPYLFPAGMKLPKFFKENLSRIEGFNNNRSVNFSEYQRTKNSSRIDASFTFYLKNERTGNSSTATCAIECKYWRKNVLISHLLPILGKARKKSSKLSFIFCNSLGSGKPETLKQLFDFCKRQKVNVIKVEKSGSGQNFNLIPYDNLPILEDPAMNCIIIELNVINPPIMISRKRTRSHK